MGQKVNPIIFQLQKTNNWKTKYFEKKSTESSINHFKDIEVQKFINKFFLNHGLAIQNLKISYYNNTLTIFISYFLTLKTISVIEKTNKFQNIKLANKNRKYKNSIKYLKIKKNIKNYIKYKEFNYTKNLKQKIKDNFLNKTKKSFDQEKQNLKLKRIKFLKYYKYYLIAKNYKNINNIKTNSFLKKFFESLSNFTNNKVNITLTLHKVNTDIKEKIKTKKLKTLQKTLIKLRRYEQNDFFKAGLNILFLCITRKNSAKLLANFMSFQLKRLKRHNFFLRFIKSTLVLFNTKTFSNIEGIKINVKGRFNKAPRARHKLLIIGKGVPIITLNSNIDYAEATAFTTNGTMGIKVWICEKN